MCLHHKFPAGVPTPGNMYRQFRPRIRCKLWLLLCIHIHWSRYERLSSKGVIWTNPRFEHLDTCDTYEQAAKSRQFRFKAVVDLESGDELLELEHETRTIRHFQYMKHVAWEPSADASL